MALLKTSQICELIGGSIKEKTCLQGRLLIIFLRIVTADSHWTINRLFLSLLVTKRWQVGDDWSRFRGQTPAMKLYQDGQEALFGISTTHTMTIFWKMHKSDKERRLNYTDLLMWQHEEYHWQKPRILVSPSTGTGDYWPPSGKAVIPETPTFSVEQQRARTLAPTFCV